MVHEEFVKDISKKSKKIDSSQDLELIYSILKAQSDLSCNINNYEYAEGDLIDYYSYYIKATKSKLDYLVKSAKSKGLILDRIKQIELQSSTDEQVI